MSISRLAGSSKRTTFASLMPAASVAWRMALASGGFWNFTCTCVPPLKSTPSGTGLPLCAQCMPMEITPATLKINEKHRKYHFFPSQSTFTLRKNSTCPIPSQRLQSSSANLLNRQLLPRQLVVHMRVEDHPRNKDRRKQIRHQTHNQRGRKSLDRPSAKEKQNGSGNDRRYVRIQNRYPRMS